MVRSKKTAVIDPNSVDIADFCSSQGINEQIFRLELMQHCDNADSLKFISPDVASQVATSIQSTSKALPQTTQEPENLTPQSFEPSQETASEVPQKPQNSDMVASTPNSLNKPPTGTAIPSLLDELIQESEDVIELADLVHQYRNTQIIENARTRDSELVVQLRERRIDNRNKIFDSLRDLNSRQPLAPDLPELPPSLKDEIKSLSDELGKQLSA